MPIGNSKKVPEKKNATGRHHTLGKKNEKENPV
jgi:hypothetical protein